MANENALETIIKLIKDLDVDVDPASRAQIHVVYLEHAKAEDIAQVLSNLSNNTSGNSRNSSRNNSTEQLQKQLHATLETTITVKVRLLRATQKAILLLLPHLIPVFESRTMKIRTLWLSSLHRIKSNMSNK